MGIKLKRIGKAALFKHQRPDIELSIGTNTFAMTKDAFNNSSFCSLEVNGAHFSPRENYLPPRAWCSAQIK